MCLQAEWFTSEDVRALSIYNNLIINYCLNLKAVHEGGEWIYDVLLLDVSN